MTKKNTVTMKAAKAAEKVNKAGKANLAKAAKATAPAAEPKAKKAAKAEKVEKPAATELRVHINKTGRVCFGKLAAERIGEASYMVITAEGKTVKLVPAAKATEGAVDINLGGGRPYVSATKILKATGGFDGSAPLDLVAKAINGNGLLITL